jgi:hypothetical protein
MSLLFVAPCFLALAFSLAIASLDIPPVGEGASLGDMGELGFRECTGALLWNEFPLSSLNMEGFKFGAVSNGVRA